MRFLLCFRPRTRPRRIVRGTWSYGSISRAASTTTKVSVGTGARSTAPSLARKKRLRPGIGQARMGNSRNFAEPYVTYLAAFFVTTFLFAPGCTNERPASHHLMRQSPADYGF